MELKDFLEMSDLSDDSEHDTDETNVSATIADNRKDIDYNEIFNQLLSDSSSDDSNTEELHDPCTGHRVTSDANVKTDENPIKSDVNPNDSLCSALKQDPIPITPAIENELQNAEESLSTDLDDRIQTEDNKGDVPNSDKRCTCSSESYTLVQEVTNIDNELFNSVKYGVKIQFNSPEYRHKLNLVHLLSDSKPIGSAQDSTLQTNDDSTVTISAKFLESLGLPYGTFDFNECVNKTDIQYRHNISKALKSLNIFEDRLLGTNNSILTRLNTTPSSLMIPTCMASSNDILVVGTTYGSLFVADLLQYNSQRNFSPYNEETTDVYPDPINWYEIHSQKNTSVTSLDILPGSNWIVAGYNDGNVNLLQCPKIASLKGQNKDNFDPKVDAEQLNNRGFGIMADAVSSAFSGFKKTNPQPLCCTTVFDTPISICKFTSSDSYDEMICCNKKNIALLTYSKTVLSHNLNVNQLQSLNDRLSDSGDIVDIVCLSSNPQAKFITSGYVGGVLVVVTMKSCVILSTRPRLSIVFTVSLDKLINKAVSNEDLTIVPSAAWMILNSGKGNVKPILIVSIANQMRFILCNLQAGSNSPSFSCVNLGSAQFSTFIRIIRIVTRLIIAILDVDGYLHILQFSLHSTPMYYDIIQTLNIKDVYSGMDVPSDLFDKYVLKFCTSSSIAVHSKGVKMIAKGYKKFSNLVTDLFQTKATNSSFELKSVSIMLLAPTDILSIEMNSWVKAIGELTASKSFPEALSIIIGLYEEWIPGLFDFKAFKGKLNQLLLYILHQSSAHIIKLAKFVNEAQSLPPDVVADIQDVDDDWRERVRSDVEHQLDSLCCSMVDSCISLDLYDSLNDLIHRCFETVNMECIFVKYILLNFYQNRIDLKSLGPQIIECICVVYDRVLDFIANEYLSDSKNIEDQILFLDENVVYLGNCACITSINSLNDIHKSQNYSIIPPSMDKHLVIYHILSSDLCKMQIFCFKNGINIDNDKAICRLSKHYLWHGLLYCQSTMAEKIGVLINIFISECWNKFGLEDNLSADVSFPLVPSEITENSFITRVLYSTVNYLLTFENGDASEDSTVNYRNMISLLMPSSSFPIVSNIAYASESLDYEDAINYDDMKNQRFKCNNDDASLLYKLLILSPRLLLVLFANLFINDKFTEYGNIVGSKIETFNFVLNNIISCYYKLESETKIEGSILDNIKGMISMLILGASLFADLPFINHSVQALAIYSLLNVTKYSDVFTLNVGSNFSKELVTPEGYFNNLYYYNMFSKTVEQNSSAYIRESTRQMILKEDVITSLVMAYLVKRINEIYNKFDCRSNISQNAHFVQIRKMCENLLSFTKVDKLSLFLHEIIGDFNTIILKYDTFDLEFDVFAYLSRLIDYIRLGTTDNADFTQLLLTDTTIRNSFVSAVMNNLLMLIKLDLPRVTELLVQMFSLDIVGTLDNSLGTSPEAILNNLEDLPDLQLLVLDAFLKSKTTGDTIHLPNTFFNRYLNLLSSHDSTNVCIFLKKQKALDINYCLRVCKKYGIDDALIYLLIRAGNFQEAITWILRSFSGVINSDLNACFDLVKTSYDLCTEHEMSLSYEIIENAWFKMLNVTIKTYTDPNFSGDRAILVDLLNTVFKLGILRFVKFHRALMEIVRYEIPFKLFWIPLQNLLSYFELQTFIANSASSISKDVLDKEFRSRYTFNNKGVVVNSIGDVYSKDVSDFKSIVFNKYLIPKIDSAKLNKIQLQLHRNKVFHNLSPFEQHLGVVFDLPIQGVKNSNKQNNTDVEFSISVNNLYNDRLSTFISENNSTRKVWNPYTLGLLPQYAQGLRKQLKQNRNSPINVFWCDHAFSQDYTLLNCPICKIYD